MVRLPFGKYPFDLRALSPCGTEPGPAFLAHIHSRDGVVKDMPFAQLFRPSHVGLVCRHLSNGSLLGWEKRAFFVHQRNGHLHIRNVRAGCFHRRHDVGRRIKARVYLVAVPLLGLRLMPDSRVRVGTPAIEAVETIVILVHRRTEVTSDINLRHDRGGISNPQLFIKQSRLLGHDDDPIEEVGKPFLSEPFTEFSEECPVRDVVIQGSFQEGAEEKICVRLLDDIAFREVKERLQEQDFHQQHGWVGMTAEGGEAVLDERSDEREIDCPLHPHEEMVMVPFKDLGVGERPE